MVDFAYHVHTDVGNRMKGAKVNGKLVPNNHELQNAEVVEIVTYGTGGDHRSRRPSPHGARRRTQLWSCRSSQPRHGTTVSSCMSTQLCLAALIAQNLELDTNTAFRPAVSNLAT